MIFLTYWFALFAAITFPLYWLIRNPLFRRVLLLVVCVVFHGHFAGPAGVLPIAVLGVLTYFAGLSRNRWACLAVLALSVASLLFYKYTHFICQELVGGLWLAAGNRMFLYAQPLVPEIPPLAISFFVFEFVHYLYDVRKGSEPLRSPLDFALFAIFWPSIVAGPVKRYKQFVPAVHEAVRTFSRRDVGIGALLFALGFVKKTIADNITEYIKFTTPAFATLSWEDRWLFFAALGTRIVLDFSGYSDMAIGLARMFGVRLPSNFNWPYLAVNLTQFWNCWHISLSSWIRDYVYIPIGGGRCGPVRKTFNGIAALALCGLWHGAAWNFLICGVYHGVGLAISSNYRTALGRPGQIVGEAMTRNPQLGWVMTLAFVNFGWLLFFFPVEQALAMFTQLVGIG